MNFEGKHRFSCIDEIRPIQIVFGFVFILSFISWSCFGQEFDSLLDQIRTENGIVGMAVEVSCSGEELASYYGGLRDIDVQLPVTEETVFRVASISKSFTAVGLMMAMDEANIALDSDISETMGYQIRNPLFPDVPITFRMLLSHTSSLQDGTGYNSFLSETYDTDNIPSISEVLLPGGTHFTDNMWRTETPGTFFAYRNINYGLIATLIEKLSSLRFDIYMKQSLLDPLEIDGSYYVNDLPDIGNLSVLYRDGEAQWDNFVGMYPPPFDLDYTPGTNGLRFAPQGGLRCSAKDLKKFGEFLLNGGEYNDQQILSSTGVEEMLSEQWSFNGTNGDEYFGLFRNWGLGFHRAQGDLGFDKVFEDRLMIGHPGEAYGLISDLYIDPESELVLVFISNGYYPGNSYLFAQNSIYYAPEEETFEAIEAQLLSTCQTLDVDDFLMTERLCGEISQNEVSASEFTSIQILRNDGSLVTRGNKKVDLQSLSQGLYFIQFYNERGFCTKKLLIR
jgi:CubicO group peptidase (beta-lactamase class C family)